MSFEVGLIEPLEGLEQTRFLLVSHTCSIIPHPETNLVALLRCPQLDGGRLPTVLDSIADVVDPYLLGPGVVAHCLWPARWADDLCVRVSNQIRQSSLSFLYDLSHVQWPHLDCPF